MRGKDRIAATILKALAAPVADVVGLTTVGGNVNLARATRNALALLQAAGRTEVPVYAGCARPMRRVLVTAEHVHGPTGLDGPTERAQHDPAVGHDQVLGCE